MSNWLEGSFITEKVRLGKGFGPFYIEMLNESRPGVSYMIKVALHISL